MSKLAIGVVLVCRRGDRRRSDVGDRRRDLSVCAWLVCLSVTVFDRRSCDLDLVAALSGVVSVDGGIGGSAFPKLECVEWSKMGSYAFENCVAGTGSRGLSTEIAN